MENIFNWITGKLAYVIQTVVMMLPDSPFQAITKSAKVNEILGYVNYFIPINQMIAIMQLWLIAVAGFYVYQAILRFARVIE